jgi:hypothetical protein
VIEELIQLAKDIKQEQQRGNELGLNSDEIAFYERLLYLLIEFPNISEKRLDTVAFVFINDLTCPLSNRFAVELLNRLLKGQVKSLMKTNATVSKLSNRFNNSTATFFCFNPSTSFKKSSDRIDKSGCSRPSV